MEEPLWVDASIFTRLWLALPGRLLFLDPGILGRPAGRDVGRIRDASVLRIDELGPNPRSRPRFRGS